MSKKFTTSTMFFLALRKGLLWVSESYLRIFWVCFAYCVCLALLVQWVVLPLLPAWHAGDGLLKGPFDWNTYHARATLEAAFIHAKGWAHFPYPPAWERPFGVVTAFYALIAPKPWTLIPLQALLSAASVVVGLLIVRVFYSNKLASLVSALILLTLPSAAVSYVQIHRDSYIHLAVVLLLYGWLLLAQSYTKQRARDLTLSWIFSSLGIAFIWFARPYLLQLFVPIGVALILLGIGFLVFHLKQFNLLGLAILLSLGAQVGGMRALSLNLVRSYDPQYDSSIRGRIGPPTRMTKEEAENVKEVKDWTRTWFVPPVIDNHLYSLAAIRDGFRFTHSEAPTNIDLDIQFRSAFDILFYIPRAIQIGFLAPFPKDWTGKGSVGVSKFLRQVTAFEMIVVYVGLMNFILSLRLFFRRPSFWIVLLFCGGIILVYGMAVTNIGTLYRLRFAFLRVLVLLGLTHLIQKKSFSDQSLPVVDSDSSWRDWFKKRKLSVDLKTCSKPG